MKKILLSLFFIFSIGTTISNAEIKPILEGDKNAKIKLIVYESLTCNHCANFHLKIYPKLKEKYIDIGIANIEFRNFPLDMAAFNASKIAHCKNDGNSEVLHYLYLNQDKWIKGSTIDDLNKNLKKALKDSSFSLDFEKCINDKLIEDYILEERISGAKNFKIEATPTLIINGETFENPLNYKKLQKYLDNKYKELI